MWEVLDQRSLTKRAPAESVAGGMKIDVNENSLIRLTGLYNPIELVPGETQRAPLTLRLEKARGG